MAFPFLISKAETSSFSNSDQKMNLNHSEDHKDTKESSVSPVSTQLYLKSSSAAASTQSSTEALDKEAVLRRIRHRKRLNKVKSAFQGLVSSSSSGQTGNEEHKWLEHYDVFSSP
ncbi:hypothetical protein ACOSP7_023005 [Xanthoceras sorbifolium]